MVDRDTEEWRRPWRDEPAVAAATAPLARPGAVGGDTDAPRGTTRPLGPSVPDGWSDVDDGPGSPAGSVRPPDATGTVDAPPRRDRRGRVVVPLVAALLGSALGTAGTLAITTRDDAETSRADVPAETEPVRAPVVPADEGDDTAEVLPGEDAGRVVSRVAQAVLPSVVNIDVFDTASGEQEQLGVGSGVIFRSDGYLLTNNHVVEDADAIEVTFSDGTILAAEVVGTDRFTDLAVLKVEGTGLPAVNLREGRPEVGETAVAIGSPFGFDGSVTAGIVSALDRNLNVPPGEGDEGGFVIPAVVQTDAAINPGNSGGALVDREGRLIGINTAILTRSGGSQGVGFAIPVASVVDAAEQLIANGFVSHPFLGVAGLDVNAELARRYQEEFDIELAGGAVIQEVVDGSGAAEGGVEVDDVVVGIEGAPIASMEDVIVEIRSYAPGDTITIDVLRGGEELALEVELSERPR